MSETKFNAELRAVLRAQGLRALHIREADQPGASDLVVWQGREILAWAELKVFPNTAEPHQTQFLEERQVEGGNAYVITLMGHVGRHHVQIAVLQFGKWVVTDVVTNYHKYDWRSYFESRQNLKI